MDRRLTYQQVHRELRTPLPDGWFPPRDHNGGPPLEDNARPWGNAPIHTWMNWRNATEKAFRGIPTEIAIRRARKAKALGLTYFEYQLEILERGRHLQPSDIIRIAEIIARREIRY